MRRQIRRFGESEPTSAPLVICLNDTLPGIAHDFVSAGSAVLCISMPGA